jgi:uncharacterized protein (TIGR02246 family)
MQTPTAIASLLLLAAIPAVAQDKSAAAPAPAAAAAVSPELAAARETAAAYVAAYNKGDAAAVAALFAVDAEWISNEGVQTSGRAAIEVLLKSVFADSKGRTIALGIEAARRITDDVFSVRGEATVSDPDGSSAVNEFTAVHVKRDGKWAITEFTELDDESAPSPATFLQDLAWFAGSWKSTEPDGMKCTVEWSPSGSFLTRTFSIPGAEGDEAREGTEIIGWDAEQEQIRSWVFESDGSFTERTWTPDGDRWLVLSRTVLPDGEVGSEEITVSKVDDDKVSWSIASRSLGGETLPNIGPVTIVRDK